VLTPSLDQLWLPNMTTLPSTMMVLLWPPSVRTEGNRAYPLPDDLRTLEHVDELVRGVTRIWDLSRPESPIMVVQPEGTQDK
jgi:hypothetical protein